MNIRTLIIPVACAAVCGCAAIDENAGTTMTTCHLDGNATLVEANTRLKNDVAVEGVTYDKTPSGMHRVNITLRSLIHKKLRLQYRIAWFNGEGMEIDADTRPYRSLTLEGMDTVTVTGVANNPAAVTSRLRLRELRAADGYRD